MAATLTGSDDRVEVVVAVGPIPAHTLITADLVTVTRTPPSPLLVDVATPEHIEAGTTTTRAITTNQILTTHDIDAAKDLVVDADRPAATRWQRGLLPLIAVIAAALVLAATTVAAWRRRRQRHTNGRVADSNRSASCGCDRCVTRERITALLGAAVCTHGPRVAAVEIDTADDGPWDTDAALEVLWDQPRLDTAAGWTVADGGWAWRRTDSTQPNATHTVTDHRLARLVEVGRRNGRRLFVNLEAFDSFGIGGDPDRVAIFATALESQVCATTHDPTGGITIIRDVNRESTGGHVQINHVGALLSPYGIRFSPINSPQPPPNIPDQDPTRTDPNPRQTGEVDAAEADRDPPEVLPLPPTLATTSPSNSEVLDTVPAQSAPTMAHRPDRCDIGDEAATGTCPGPAMLVRVLGAPSVPDRPNLTRRQTILTTLLACRGGTLAASAAQDAVWGGKPVEPKTVWNLVAATRRALGEFGDGTAVMLAADRRHNTLRLDPRVTTDADLLAARLDEAHTGSSIEAIRLLHDGLAMVHGPPFDGIGYDWAHRDQDVTQAASLIERTVDTLVTLATEADHIDIARAAITCGLRGLPGNEDLYRTRMHVEHDAGNLSGVIAAYDELTSYLADLDTAPSPASTALLHELRDHRRR